MRWRLLRRIRYTIRLSGRDLALRQGGYTLEWCVCVFVPVHSGMKLLLLVCVCAWGGNCNGLWLILGAASNRTTSKPPQSRGESPLYTPYTPTHTGTYTRANTHKFHNRNTHPHTRTQAHTHTHCLSMWFGYVPSNPAGVLLKPGAC